MAMSQSSVAERFNALWRSSLSWGRPAPPRKPAPARENGFHRVEDDDDDHDRSCDRSAAPAAKRTKLPGARPAAAPRGESDSDGGDGGFDGGLDGGLDADDADAGEEEASLRGASRPEPAAAVAPPARGAVSVLGALALPAGTKIAAERACHVAQPRQ